MRTTDAMQRHDFDPIAFVFGVLFTGSGLLLLIGRFDLFNHARWLWPGLLVLLGIAVLVGARGSSRARERALGGSAASPAPLRDVPDLDDIEPPVGPEAFRLPGWPPRGAETPKPTAASGAETSKAASDTETSEPAGPDSETSKAASDTDVLEPAEWDTEVIAEVDQEADTRPLREPRPPKEPPASG
jgi:hypothetical protein